jgi:hypothetical protein
MAISDKNIVSDNFWLNLGAEQVYGTLAARSAATDRLQKNIVWVFSIYTSIAIAGVVFSKKEDWNTYTLVSFGLAFLFLTISYWLASLSTFSHPESFYGSDVKSITTAFNNAIKSGNSYFNWATALCSAGVFFYSAALFLLFAYQAIAGFNKPAGVNLAAADSLYVVTTASHNPNSYDIQIQCKKNSWVEVTALVDTTILQRIRSDTIAILGFVKQNSIQIYIDSTAKIIFHLQLDGSYKKGQYLMIKRTDTLESATLVRTISKKLSL